MAKGTGNLSNLSKCFSDEPAARQLLESMRWPNGAACPRCGGADPYKLNVKASGKNPARKGLWKCKACRKQFTVTTGTIFESSHIAISKWLLALHLICASKKGMSAHQLHRMLGITYRAAWFVNHRLRHAMADGDVFAKLAGVIEIDETYVGAKRKRGTHRGRPSFGSHKTPVVALVQRGGKVRAFPMPRVTSDNLKAAMQAHLKPEAQIVTDEYPAYKRPASAFASHDQVTHSRGEYVRGKIHTNTVEGFFSLLKRGINGSFHHVSKAHLFRYVDEFTFRHNTRMALGFNDSDRAAMLVLKAEGKRLTYKKGAGASAA
jgi:transposase-like protein